MRPKFKSVMRLCVVLPLCFVVLVVVWPGVYKDDDNDDGRGRLAGPLQLFRLAIFLLRLLCGVSGPQTASSSRHLFATPRRSVKVKLIGQEEWGNTSTGYKFRPKSVLPWTRRTSNNHHHWPLASVGGGGDWWWCKKSFLHREIIRISVQSRFQDNRSGEHFG